MSPLFGGRQTADWPPPVPGPVRFDLATGTIQGIPPGATYDAFRPIGRPSNGDPVAKGMFAYPELGVALFVKPEFSNADFEFRERDVFGEPGSSAKEAGFVPCRVAFRRSDGAEREVSSATTRNELESFLGTPSSVEATEDFVVLSYATGAWLLEFEFSTSGVLHTLRIEPPAS